MEPKNSTIDNLVCMQVVDRRRARRLEPPYITDEGFVLVDRRCEEDQPAAPAALSLCESDAEAIMS